MNLQMTSNFLSFYSFVNVPNKLGYKCERSRSNRGKAVQLLLRQQGIIERMDKITALGIVINNRLTATDHISFVLTACSSLLYALRGSWLAGAVREGCVPGQCSPPSRTACLHGSDFVLQLIIIDSTPSSVVALSEVFGRPFVKRFALCYRSVVCLSCLSCL